MTTHYLEKFELMLDTAYVKLMRERGRDISSSERDRALLRGLRRDAEMDNPDNANAIYKAVDDQVWNAAHMPWRIKIALEKDELDIWHVTAEDLGGGVSTDRGLEDLFRIVKDMVEKLTQQNDKAFRKFHADTEAWMKAYQKQIHAARKATCDLVDF
jgi:hypothetical protein